MKVVLASGNAGKQREFDAMLAGHGLEVVPQSAFGVDAVEETGTTFVENAIIKARHAAAATGLPALADDSGIVVDALGGAPGVRSARYAGADATDADNVLKLLDALRDVPDEARTCRFVCVIVLMRDAGDPLPRQATGVWEGRVLHAPRGTNGFGYDPVFLSPAHGCASAELDGAVKNRVSHRAQAFAALVRALGAT